MSVRVDERVEEWSQRPFDGGYAGLRDLADATFSGVVRAGGAELYMTAGTVVGIHHGDIEDFESATGTAYQAPEPALPLLCVMEAADADVRAEYYSEDTPISEVDATLTDGSFTGYLELSENVLSGDYYLVYHGGTSMAVGFVGASEQLIAAEEAFETADDEVGIYKVRQVDVEPIDIPAPAAGTPGAEAAETGSPASAEETAEAAAAADAAGGADSEGGTPAAEETGAAGQSRSTRQAQGESAEAETPPAEESDQTPEADRAGSGEPEVPADDAARAPSGESASAAEPSAGAESPGAGTEEATPGSGATAAGSGSTAPAGSGGTRGRDSGGPDPSTGSAGAEAGPGTAAAGSATGGGQHSPSDASQADVLETRAVPSLDPGLTHVPERQTGGEHSTAQPDAPVQESGRDQPAGAGHQAAPSEDESPQPAGQETPAGESATGGPPAEELEAELADREAEIERLEAERREATAERDDLAAELEAAIEERDELAAEVERLKEKLARLEGELGAATDAERRLTPSEAVAGTNLFVDYDSKGAATLAMAHEGSVGVEEVAENLQLGVHTEFEQAGVAVDGQEFDAFLGSTLHYRVAEWLIGSLLFEIRNTGHVDALTDLYDAIPEIRRVEFNGTVDVEYAEDGQEKGGREQFDVIFRHRMGDPLVVANLNDARDPATGSMMETLVTAAERVGQTADALSGAVLVTSSFFESEALETVSEATQGGLLSRDKRTSFVNLSRKRGYHLCLVAARDGNFHMEVPEL